MLAAASPARDQFPALFQLALQLLSADRDLPQGLSQHVSRVITEALGILADPQSVQQDTLPEAIQLALALRRSQPLKAAIELGHNKGVTAEVAKDVLALERELAASP